MDEPANLGIMGKEMMVVLFEPGVVYGKRRQEAAGLRGTLKHDHFFSGPRSKIGGRQARDPSPDYDQGLAHAGASIVSRGQSGGACGVTPTPLEISQVGRR